MVELDDKMRMILWILLLVGGAVCIIMSIGLFAAGALYASAGAAAEGMAEGAGTGMATYGMMYTVSAIIFLIIGIVLIIIAIMIYLEKLF